MPGEGELERRLPPHPVGMQGVSIGSSRVAVAHNAGHESFEMLSVEYRALLSDLLHGKLVESRTIDMPPRRFRMSRD